MSVRRNEVATIAQLSSWMYLPLTPARQAAIAAFEVKHQADIIPHLLDALDDIVFDTGRPIEGGSSTDQPADDRQGQRRS